MIYKLDDPQWEKNWKSVWKEKIKRGFSRKLAKNFGYDLKEDQRKLENLATYISQFKKPKSSADIDRLLGEDSTYKKAFLQTLKMDEDELQGILQKIANSDCSIGLRNTIQNWIEPTFFKNNSPVESSQNWGFLQSIFQQKGRIIVVIANIGKTYLLEHLVNNYSDNYQFFPAKDEEEKKFPFVLLLDSENKEYQKAIRFHKAAKERGELVSLLIMVNEEKDIPSMENWGIPQKDLEIFGMEINIDRDKSQTVLKAMYNFTQDEKLKLSISFMENWIKNQGTNNWPSWCRRLEDFIQLLEMLFETKKETWQNCNWDNLLSEILCQKIAQHLPLYLKNRREITQEMLALFASLWLKESLSLEKSERYSKSVLLKPSKMLFEKTWERALEVCPAPINSESIAYLWQELESTKLDIKKLRKHLGTWHYIAKSIVLKAFLESPLWIIRESKSSFSSASVNQEQAITLWFSQVISYAKIDWLQDLFPSLLRHMNDSLLDTSAVLQKTFQAKPELLNSDDYLKSQKFLSPLDKNLITLTAATVTDITDEKVLSAWKFIFTWWNDLPKGKDDREFSNPSNEYVVHRVHLPNWRIKFAYRYTKLLRQISKKYRNLLPFIGANPLWQKNMNTNLFVRADWFQWTKKALDALSKEASDEEKRGALASLSFRVDETLSFNEPGKLSYSNFSDMLEWEPLEWLAQSGHPQALALVCGEAGLQIIDRFPQECRNYIGKGSLGWECKHLSEILSKHYALDPKVEDWYLQMSDEQQKKFFVNMLVEGLEGNKDVFVNALDIVKKHNPEFLTPSFLKVTVEFFGDVLEEIAMISARPEYLRKESNEVFTLVLDSIDWEAYEEVLHLLLCPSEEEMEARHQWLVNLHYEPFYVAYLNRLQQALLSYLIKVIDSPRFCVNQFKKFIHGCATLLHNLEIKLNKLNNNNRSMDFNKLWRLTFQAYRCDKNFEKDLLKWSLDRLNARLEKLSPSHTWETREKLWSLYSYDPTFFHKEVHLLHYSEREQKKCYQQAFRFIERDLDNLHLENNSETLSFFFLHSIHKEERGKLIPKFMKELQKRKKIYNKWRSSIMEKDCCLSMWLKDEYFFFSIEDDELRNWHINNSLDLEKWLQVAIKYWQWVDNDWFLWFFTRVEAEHPDLWPRLIDTSSVFAFNSERESTVLDLALNNFFQLLDTQDQVARVKQIFTDSSRQFWDKKQNLERLLPWIISLLPCSEATRALEKGLENREAVPFPGVVYQEIPEHILEAIISPAEKLVKNLGETSLPACDWREGKYLPKAWLDILSRLAPFVNLDSEIGIWCCRQIHLLIKPEVWQKQDSIAFLRKVLEILPSGQKEICQELFLFMMEKLPSLLQGKQEMESHAVECLRVLIEHIGPEFYESKISFWIKKAQTYKTPPSEFLYSSLLEIILPRFLKCTHNSEFYCLALEKCYSPLVSNYFSKGYIDLICFLEPMLSSEKYSQETLSFYLEKIISTEELASLIRVLWYQESICEGWINWENWPESPSIGWQRVSDKHKEPWAKSCRELKNLEEIIKLRLGKNPKEKELWQFFLYAIYMHQPNKSLISLEN